MATQIPLSAYSQPFPSPTPYSSLPPSRSEKSTQLFGQILPASLALGLQNYERASLVTAATSDIAATGAGAQAAATGAAASSVGTAAWGATIAGGILGLTNIAMNWGRSTPAAGASSGLAVGAAIGTLIAPGIGTGLGAAIGALAGGLLGSIKTGKHRDQVMRDQVRSALVQNGILDASYSFPLANGSLYNIGIDGGPKSEFGGRRPYEIDFNNPLATYAVSWLNPLISLMSRGNTKVQTDFVGYFTNAAISNAQSLDDVRKNVNAIFARFGVSDEALYKTIISAAQSGQLDQNTAAAYINGINQRRNPAFVGELPQKPSVTNHQQL